ncbi:MAG: AI-2E family transporter [Actinomycetota bacterium]
MTTCPRCSAQIAETDAFCPACGFALRPDAAPAIPYRLVLTIIGLVVASGVGILLVVSLRKVIFEVVIAGFLALVLNPAVLRLQRLRLTRGQSIAIVIVIMTIAILSIGTLIGAPLATSLTHFAQSAPERLRDAAAGKGTLGHIVMKLHLQDQLHKASTSLSNRVSELSGAVLSVGRRVASAAFTTAIVIIIAIFMLVEGPRLVDGTLRLVPNDHEEAARRIGQTASRVIAGYTTGVLMMAVLNGAVAGLAMALTGTPFVLPLATWAAVIDILPIIGGLLSIVPAALFGFTHSIAAGVTVGVAIFVYQQIKNHILYPVVVGRAVSLGSLLVLVSVLAGAELAGIGGAVLAIPVAGVINAVLVEIARFRAARRAETIAVETTEEPATRAVTVPPSRLRAAATRLRKRASGKATSSP